MEQFNSIYARGQGPLMIAPWVDGSPAGFEFVGDMGDVSGSSNTSKTPIKENVTGKRATVGNITTDQSYPLNLGFRSVKPSHLAAALQAVVTVKAAANATDEPQTGYHDKFIVLDHLKVSSVDVTNDTGATTYTPGTDYIVHGDMGAIEILSTGSISDGQALLIDYAYAAQKQIKANPENQYYVISFNGINTANNNKRGRCTIYKAQIDPAFLSLIQEDSEAALPVTGEMFLDDTRPAGDQLFSWVYED